MMKKVFLCVLVLFCLGLAGGTYILLTDSYSEARFRTMQDPLSNPNGVNLQGLRELQVSGGPIVRFKELKQRLAHIKKPIIIVDGQRQYHGYLGEIPTVFFAYERKPDLRHTFRRKFFTGTTEILADQVTKEKELANKYGFQYVNIKIDSKVRTPDNAVDEFVEFVDNLPDDVWVHFHCRLGRGRTSMMLIMYDTMKNAPQVAFEDIVTRQHLLGSENLFNVTSRRHGTYTSATLQRRKIFVEDFYNFVCQRKAGGVQRWSDWRKQTQTKLDDFLDDEPQSESDDLN